MNIEGLEIEKVQVLSLQPNDILVLKVKSITSADAAQALKEQVTKFLINHDLDNYVWVFQDDIDIEVVRKEAK